MRLASLSEWPVPGTPAKLRLEADKTILKAVDSTDDVHLQITILDAAGKELSNAVPVTLTLISGPGEFPTGPSITFEPKSDIAMLAGKAATEFRSYRAGTSVLRATSPGLASADITIVSQGESRRAAVRKRHPTPKRIDRKPSRKSTRNPTFPEGFSLPDPHP